MVPGTIKIGSRCFTESQSSTPEQANYCVDLCSHCTSVDKHVKYLLHVLQEYQLLISVTACERRQHLQTARPWYICRNE